MVISLIKNFVIFICSFYTFSVSINKQQRTLLGVSLPIIFSTLLSAEMVFLTHTFPISRYLLPFLTFYILLLLLNTMPAKSTFYHSLFIYGINLLIYSIVGLFLTIVLAPFSLSISRRLINYISLATTIIYPLILWFIIHTKIFKNIINCLLHNLTSRIWCCLIFLILVIISLTQTTPSNLSNIYVAIIFSILLATFVLILWWRAQITKSYRERLRALEVESLRVSKQEQAEYISQLERENERMGRIIHKDNRIVNAMADSISEYLQYSAFLSGNKLAEKGSSLQAQISEIRYDRQVLLDEKPATPTALPQTGYAGIDAMVTYMAKEASENKINFQFHYGEDFFTEGGEDIKETDIVHLLSDSLENAIIATKFAGGKFIELSMLKIKGFPLISISDSGIPFELDTYMNLGLQKASTHLDTGGSGIGLMDLWELKEKYKATLYIDEHPEDANMTKRIVYIFDKKNRYMISTDRSKELQQKQTRADMFVINPNTEAVI